MPELRFAISWPDGTRETFYSPSTIVERHFEPGRGYPVAEFVTRSRTALTAASERVRLVFGTPCSIALGELARLEATAARYPTDAEVVFESFKE